MSLRGALTFLSRIPTGAGDDAGVAGALVWFPVAGLLVGAVLGLGAAIELRFLPALVGAFVFLPTYFLVKGILHTDGLADTFDALGAHGSAKERDAILRDPHVGVAGAIAVAIFVLGLFALVAALPEGPGRLGFAGQFFAPLAELPLVVPILAETAASTGIVAAFALAPLSPQSRLARSMAPGATPGRLAGAVATGVVLLVVLGGWLGVLAAVGAAAVAGFVAWAARRRFAGLSGDLLGSGHDITFLLVLALASGVAWLR